MVRKRILLGVDVDSFAPAINFFSNRDKFGVTVVYDGAEALQAIVKEKPDLAILSVNLPEKGGDECCWEVKDAGLSPATSIVLVVWAQDSSDIKRCLAARCDALLVKPLDYERMAAIVTKLLFGGKSIPPRINVRLPVRYGIPRHELTDDFSVNLSTGGVFLEAKNIVPVGTSLKVAFSLPDDGTTVQCTAEVAWLNGPVMRSQPLLPQGMGLKFLDIGNREVNAIRQFLFSEKRAHWA